LVVILIQITQMIFQGRHLQQLFIYLLSLINFLSKRIKANTTGDHLDVLFLY
jgi:hypothetical protein